MKKWKERLIATKGIGGILGVFIIVIGGIYAGFFTPTEAGAMGSISPPFGVVVFAIYGMVKEVPLFTIFRGCLPFLGTMAVCLVILVAVPQILMLLPDLAIPYR